MTKGRVALASTALLIASCGSSSGRPEPETGSNEAVSTTVAVDRADGITPTSTTEGASGRGQETAGDIDAMTVTVGRADISTSGNRIAVGDGSFVNGVPTDVPLPGTPVWVLPIETESSEIAFAVELDDGTTVVAGPDGLEATDVTTSGPQPSFSDFEDPLPDGRIVEAEGVAAMLVGPTDRYPHGVLGDRIEAAAVEVVDLASGGRTVFGPEPPTVIEGIAPILADVDDDGTIEVLVTQSNAEVGAWLAVWSTEGELLAESIAIGRGNRWRNQLGVAPIGPGGEIEVLDVRTPHLGGTVQFFRMEGSELTRVASKTGYTSHVIGSRNLDLGIVADADGDGVLEVVLPNDDRTALGVVRRGGDSEFGTELVADVALPGRLTTNVAVAAGRDGRLTFAAGTDGAVLRIWPG